MTTLDFYGGDRGRAFDATGYFRLEQTDERWWLVDPDGNGFITIGFNHAEESNLKHPNNVDIWKEKYGSRERWIRAGPVKDLKDWGVALDGAAADYAVANMPYCLQLRVAAIEDWNGHPAFPEDFDKYCDFLARSICSDHADSKNLVGYFLVDIPAWLPHAGGGDFPQLEGLDEKERNDKLFDVATKYYATITKHIRTYDSNHLILGDRFNGNKGIPGPVLEAMKPFVDVLSIQYFTGADEESHKQMKEDFDRWHEASGKPVINANLGNWTPTEMNPNRASDIESQGERGRDYANAIGELLSEPWFLGWHWCAYVENTARGWGIKDPWDEPYKDFVNPARNFNRGVYERLRE